MKKLFYFIILVIISTSCIDVKDYGQTPENINLNQEATKLLLQSTKDSTITYIYENSTKGDVVIISQGEVKGRYILGSKYLDSQSDLLGISIFTTIMIISLLFLIYKFIND